MNEKTFKHARFITTAVDISGCPVLKDPQGRLLPEIAVAGRSNVGKSSLLNHLFNSKGLVKTSSTPGKTQALNFFTVNNELVFVDLPGYGYAKVSPVVRKKWGPMINGYLSQRPQLRVVFFLFDIRRIPNEEDQQFIEWAANSGKAIILILTKVDKVNQSEKVKCTRQIMAAFRAENLHHVEYSVTRNVGRRELLRMMFDALQSESLEALTSESQEVT